MSTVWQNTAGACSKSFPAAGLPLMGLLPPARPSALPASLPCAELFLAGGERLRQMTPCDGCRSLPCVERRLVAPFRAPQTHIGVCKSGRGCIAKKIGANRAPSPARVCSGNDDLAFSLLSLCLPAKTCRCKSGQAPGCISRIFFRQPFALFVAAPTTTTTTAGPLSPPFLQPSKMSVSANYFFLSS